MSDSERNELVVRRFIEECINNKRLDLVEELFSPEYVNNAATPDISPDLEGYKQRLSHMFEAFPDLHITVEDSFATGDKVAIRLTAGGAHQGQYMGIPATGKDVTWTATAIYHVVGERIVERWENRDDLGLLRQLQATTD